MVQELLWSSAALIQVLELIRKRVLRKMARSHDLRYFADDCYFTSCFVWLQALVNFAVAFVDWVPVATLILVVALNEVIVDDVFNLL